MPRMRKKLKPLEPLLKTDDDEDDDDDIQLCKYHSTPCHKVCAIKRNGEFHSLCELHREKQNAAQKKSDAKRRSVISQRRRRKRYHLQEEDEEYEEENVFDSFELFAEFELDPIITNINI